MVRNEQLAVLKGYRVDDDGNVYGPSGRKLKVWYQDGYPIFRVGHSSCSVPVHRLAAYQKFGEALYVKGIECRHVDGNPSNSKPDNIILGTASDNAMDKDPAVRLGAAKKAAAVLRKLTESERDALLRDRRDGATYSELMKKYGLAKSTVSYIVNGKTYR